MNSQVDRLNSHNDYEEPVLEVDKKLSNLMMKGWILLADVCPIESCSCPLMKSPDGQKYCVGCEMWHFDKEKKVKQKFGELVSLKGKQNIQLKSTQSSEVSKIQQNPVDFNITLNKTVLNSLQMKLAYLSNILNNEKEINKSKEILECMRICMENIQTANSLNYN
jgi:uncharacterized Zn finger protein (UPF0148 family)